MKTIFSEGRGRGLSAMLPMLGKLRMCKSSAVFLPYFVPACKLKEKIQHKVSLAPKQHTNREQHLNHQTNNLKSNKQTT